MATCLNLQARRAKRLANWTPDEEAALEKLVGTRPLPHVITSYSRYAARQGWLQRSPGAIESKLTRMKLSCKCTLDNFTIPELARHLNVSRDRVEQWVKRGLPMTKLSRSHSAIKRTHLKQFAQSQPQRLAGIDPECLSWLLDDAELVQQIALMPRMRQGSPNPVQRLDTGEIYPSAHAADKASYLSRGQVATAIRTAHRAAGTYWRYLHA